MPAGVMADRKAVGCCMFHVKGPSNLSQNEHAVAFVRMLQGSTWMEGGCAEGWKGRRPRLLLLLLLGGGIWVKLLVLFMLPLSSDCLIVRQHLLTWFPG